MKDKYLLALLGGMMSGVLLCFALYKTAEYQTYQTELDNAAKLCVLNKRTPVLSYGYEYGFEYRKPEIICVEW